MTKKKASATKRAKSASHLAQDEARLDADVTALLDGAGHPLRSDIERVRRLLLAASPRATEGVKWNSASYRASDWFATVNLRSRDAVQLVFHTGAKAKDSATKGVGVLDPAGLLKWLAKDRALVTLGAGRDIDERADAFARLVREWIALTDGFTLVEGARVAPKKAAKKVATKIRKSAGSSARATKPRRSAR